MMERISIQEIATVLIEKNGLKKKEAEQFVITMFELVKESLVSDRLVKVKGLGTFKIVDIDARESVNVNTGERVLIEGHDKITFTPDTTMKELVNKPFSQFETVVLNDGVTFEDMPEIVAETDTPEVEETPEPAPVMTPPEEPIIDNQPEEPLLEEITVEEPLEEEAPVVKYLFEAIPEESGNDSEKLITEEPGTTEAEAETITIEEEPEEEIEEEYMSKKMTYFMLAIAIFACIMSFVAGYYYRENFVPPVVVEEMKEGIAVPADSVIAGSQKVDSIAKASSLPITKTEVRSELKSEPIPDNKPEAKSEPKPEPKAEPQAAASPDKYEQMDVRVRTGAYRIVGSDYQTKVKAGETLAKIARRTLGPDMECYLEVFNGIKSSADLKEGQTIKIPKLELKKKKKVNN